MLPPAAPLAPTTFAEIMAALVEETVAAVVTPVYVRGVCGGKLFVVPVEGLLSPPLPPHAVKARAMGNARKYSRRIGKPP
jgi:hypothetical protein